MPESVVAFASRYDAAVQAGGGPAADVDPIVAALFDEELVGSLAGIPYDLAALGTGHEHWPLADKERKALGVVGALYLRHRLKLDPTKALDFFFWGTVAAFTLPRALREMALVAEDLKRKREAEKENIKPQSEGHGPAQP